MKPMGQKPNPSSGSFKPQSFGEGIQSIVKDFSGALKDDLAEGVLDDAAWQAKLSKKTPLEKLRERHQAHQETGQRWSLVEELGIVEEQTLIDFAPERHKREAEEKKVTETAQINQLSQEIKHLSELEEAKIEGAVEQLVETQIEIAKEAGVSTHASVDQRPQKVGIAHLVLERLKLKWLQQKIHDSKTWLETGQAKVERITGMMVFVKGKQMQGIEQQVWQHQG